MAKTEPEPAAELDPVTTELRRLEQEPNPIALQLGATAETFEAVDPIAGAITFTLRGWLWRPWQAHLQATERSDSKMQTAIVSAAVSKSLDQLRGQAANGDDAIEEVDVKVLDESGNVILEAMQEVDTAVLVGDYMDGQEERRSPSFLEARARAMHATGLLVGWHGWSKPCNEAAVVELLTDPTPTNRARGERLGPALQAFIEERARAFDAVQASAAEDLLGN